MTTDIEYTFVFTYGTLMRKQCRNEIMEKYAVFCGTTSIKGYKLYDYPLGGYPVAVYTGSEEDVIPGELYLVTSNLIPILDKIEGEGTLYSRECVTTTSDVEAIMYAGIEEFWDGYRKSGMISSIPSGTQWSFENSVENSTVEC